MEAVKGFQLSPIVITDFLYAVIWATQVDLQKQKTFSLKGP